MGTKKQNTLPRGITIRSHKDTATINIRFTYKGVSCREPLSTLEIKPKNIKYAERLLAEVQNSIIKGVFQYSKFFPTSKKLKFFGDADNQRRVLHYLNEYIEICITRGLSPSTIDGYKKCRNALAEMHSVSVVGVTPSLLKTWIKNRKTKLKTTRNTLSFLRSALDEAVTDGLISINPVTLVTASRYQSTETNSESTYIVDPLTPAEIKTLYNATYDPQHKNLFQFALHTGLRSSELCALSWADIDFIGKTVHVKNASVSGVIKCTKTRSGTRSVELDHDAMDALIKQKAITFMKDKFVFEDPKTNQPWAGADAIRKKAWVPTLRKAGIRYRNPYQTRHTFATRHISQGANLFWLAQQMGHKGPEMLFRHYGSYLKEYAGNTSLIVKRA